MCNKDSGFEIRQNYCRWFTSTFFDYIQLVNLTGSSCLKMESSTNMKYEKVNKFSSTFSTYLTLYGFTAMTADLWRFPFLVQRSGGGKQKN